MSEVVDYIMHAEDLTPAHVGRRVRVKVLPGPIVEDDLIGFSADLIDGKLRIFLRFNNTAPASMPLDYEKTFAVMPNASVELIGTRKLG